MTTYDLFTGFVEAWPATWEGANVGGDDNVEIQAVDAFKVLNLAEITTSRGQEFPGARIAALLDTVSWSADQSIEDGDAELQAATYANENLLAAISDAAASEGGVFFIASDGTATFYDRFHGELLDEDDDLWGDDGDEKRYSSITTSYDDFQIWNEVIVTSPTLDDQSVSDASSQSTYGGVAISSRTLTVNTTLADEATMLSRAEYLLARYKDPHFRITSLQIDNASLDDAQWPRILMRELLDRINVRKRPGEGDMIEQPSAVEGITYEITPGRWVVTWNLSSASFSEGQWELGTVGLSELGETTTLVGV